MGSTSVIPRALDGFGFQFAVMLVLELLRSEGHLSSKYGPNACCGRSNFTDMGRGCRVCGYTNSYTVPTSPTDWISNSRRCSVLRHLHGRRRHTSPPRRHLFRHHQLSMPTEQETYREGIKELEPPRVCRMLQLLRDWSHDQRIKIAEVFRRGA